MINWLNSDRLEDEGIIMKEIISGFCNTGQRNELRKKSGIAGQHQDLSKLEITFQEFQVGLAGMLCVLSKQLSATQLYTKYLNMVGVLPKECD